MKKKFILVIVSLILVTVVVIVLLQSSIVSYFLHSGFEKAGKPVKVKNISANLFSGKIQIQNFEEVEKNTTDIKYIKIESSPLNYLSNNIQLNRVTLKGGIIQNNSFIFTKKKDSDKKKKISVKHLLINDLVVFLPRSKSFNEPMKLEIEELTYQLDNSLKFNYDHLERISFNGIFHNSDLKINYPAVKTKGVNEIKFKNVSIKNYQHLLPVVYGLIKNRKLNGKMLLSLKSEKVINVKTIIDLNNIELIKNKDVGFLKIIPFKLLRSYLNNNIKKELEVNFALPKSLFLKHPRIIKQEILKILPKLILLQIF